MGLRQNLEGLIIDQKPFDSNRRILETALEAAGAGTNMDKAHRLFLWVRRNIEYDDSMQFFYSYRSAREVFRDKKGKCAGLSFLYIAMARIAGLKAFYARVKEEDNGSTAPHACAGVYLNNELTLVDCARDNGFGIKHKRINLMRDDEIAVHFNNVLVKPNIKSMRKTLRIFKYALPISLSFSIWGYSADFYDNIQKKKEAKEYCSQYPNIISSKGLNENEAFYARFHNRNIPRFRHMVDVLRRAYPEDGKFDGICYNMKNLRDITAEYLMHIRKKSLPENH